MLLKVKQHKNNLKEIRQIRSCSRKGKLQTEEDLKVSDGNNETNQGDCDGKKSSQELESEKC